MANYRQIKSRPNRDVLHVATRCRRIEVGIKFLSIASFISLDMLPAEESLSSNRSLNELLVRASSSTYLMQECM